ncbi:MAG: PAS domain S-box protein, partial [Proteobacteria bacterium]|nr:PAS domain S-box protein [Pseudomonadota bacterium]
MGAIKNFIQEIPSDKLQVFETVHTTKDGKPIPVEIQSCVVKYLGKDAILSIGRDITERKRAEQEKEKLETQLRQAHKMESIGTIAGGIAHDFNNILASVMGYTELALDDAKKGTMQYQNLQEVLLAGNRATELVKQILTFSRQTDQEQKPVQVRLMIMEALKLLRASIPSTIEIRQNIQSNALIIGDSTQVQQVLMNLCTNAAHAM